MEFNFELTPQARILLGILGIVLFIVLVLQGGPAFYELFANRNIDAKQKNLANAENLVHAAEILKPIEREIYKDTGLASSKDTPDPLTIFHQEHPETVIRKRVDELIKRAGVEQNYQLRTKPSPSKQTVKLGTPARQNLVLYLYMKHLEAEKKSLEAEAEQETEDDTFSKLMNAWLGEDKPPEKGKTENIDSSKKIATTIKQREFASLPEIIPIQTRIELADFILSMISQELLGASNFRPGFLEAQIYEHQSPATPGIFGIGAKPTYVEIQFRANSKLLDVLTQSLRTQGALTSETLPAEEFIVALIDYVGQIQEQRTALLRQLDLAPSTYQFDNYIIEMKFKTSMEKLVNLNHLIETNTKWLSAKDLRITVDKQSNTRPNEERERPAGRAADRDQLNLNVDLVMIAQIF